MFLLKMPSALMIRRVVTRNSWLRQAHSTRPMRPSEASSTTSSTMVTMPSIVLLSKIGVFVPRKMSSASAMIAATIQSQVSARMANQCWRLSKTISSPRDRRFVA